MSSRLFSKSATHQVLSGPPSSTFAFPSASRVGRDSNIMPTKSNAIPKRVAVRANRTPPEPDSGRLTIGVDMGGTKIALAVVSDTGEVLASHRHSTDTADSADQIVGVIASCIKTCLGDPARGARAVGVGVAGQIREGDGVLLSAPNLPWRNVPLAAKLAKATGLPSTVMNDVRAATLGEWKFGAGRGERDLVCVFIGTGVGGGIVADGQLRSGSSNTAGEVGHLTIVSDGRSCHCPNSGCLEAYVGGWAIAERAQELAKARPNESGRLRRSPALSMRSRRRPWPRLTGGAMRCPGRSSKPRWSTSRRVSSAS